MRIGGLISPLRLSIYYRLLQPRRHLRGHLNVDRARQEEEEEDEEVKKKRFEQPLSSSTSPHLISVCPTT